MISNVFLVTRKFSYHYCTWNSLSAISNQAWLLSLTHRLISRKFKEATCAFDANNHFSFRLFFLFRQDVGQFPCWTKDGSSCFDFSHILLLRCDARWRQAVYPPFPGNKTDEEKGCRLNIGTVPSWRETFYFRSCKWVVPCRNCLGTVPKLWRTVPIF